MPRPTLDEVLDVPDPMLNDNFELEITKVPGGGDGRQLRIQCKSGVKPGMTLGEIEVELFGHKVKHAGRKTFSGTMQISFVEAHDGRIVKQLEGWSETARATDTQTGSFKADYSTTATLTIYDQTGNAALVYEIYGVWPTEVADYQFDGSGGSNLTNDATFSYDYYKRIS